MAMKEIGIATQCCSAGAAQELHVLAVDDSLVDRKVIERLLKKSCCKVTAVESGHRALQYLGLDGEKSAVGFDSLKVNLILTDYSMPEMTGYDLLKKIKGSSALRKIPVVIMSSENILARIDRCLEEGAEEYLVKPVKLADVKRIKDSVLRGGDENGKKQNSEASAEGGDKESRKRNTFKEDPSSPDQPLSLPSSPPAVMESLAASSQESHWSRTQMGNACEAPSLLISSSSSAAASEESHLKRARLDNAADV